MRIAYLEDNQHPDIFLTKTLTEDGHVCRTFNDGSRLIRQLKLETFDMLLLDWQVPGMTGQQVTVWVRANLNEQIPIVFATYRSLESDIVSALNAGADDYLIKPVRKAELLARLYAVARRVSARQAPAPQLIEAGPYRIDPQTRTCFLHNAPVALTPREFDLVLLMFKYQGHMLSRDHIGGVVWTQPPGTLSRTIDTHMSKVRSKLQLGPENGVRLVPVYGQGYRLDVCDSPATSE